MQRFLAGAPGDTQRNGKSSPDDLVNWASAIKQALMPVTPQPSGQSGDLNRNSDMVQLKVPAPGRLSARLGFITSKFQARQAISAYKFKASRSSHSFTRYSRTRFSALDSSALSMEVCCRSLEQSSKLFQVFIARREHT